MSEQNKQNEEVVKKETKSISKMKQDFDDVLGHGKIVKVDTGDKEKFAPDGIAELHFTPVVLNKMPELIDAINNFSKKAGSGSWDKDAINSSLDIIHLSLQKYHKDIAKEEIGEWFDIGGLAYVVRIAIDMNRFLEEMEQVGQAVPAIQTQTKTQR